MRRWRFYRKRRRSTIAPAGQAIERRPVPMGALIAIVIIAAAVTLVVYQIVNGA